MCTTEAHKYATDFLNRYVLIFEGDILLYFIQEMLMLSAHLILLHLRNRLPDQFRLAAESLEIARGSYVFADIVPFVFPNCAHRADNCFRKFTYNGELFFLAKTQLECIMLLVSFLWLRY